MIKTIETLLMNGADVNAVADKDVLPLTLALDLPSESLDKEDIIDMLQRR